ncbi:MAG TPA: DUF2510 domain-containing protein [Acidimicrobiales bacterium]|nr:DUF2510 domain-containing protein [Acidimicrobiales bacterium]
MSTTTILISLVCALFGYRFSVRTGIVRGATPWRMPSIAWGLICLTGPLGLLLEFVAVRTTKTPALPVESGQVAVGYQWPTTANDAVAASLPDVAQPGIAPANDGSGKMALFGWYPDPSGRHERRYWDGKGWTSLVEDHLVAAEDPL